MSKAELDRVSVIHSIIDRRQQRSKRDRLHCRSRLGELVQIDGSPHDWFEGRATFLRSAKGHITQIPRYRVASALQGSVNPSFKPCGWPLQQIMVASAERFTQKPLFGALSVLNRLFLTHLSCRSRYSCSMSG